MKAPIRQAWPAAGLVLLLLTGLMPGKGAHAGERGTRRLSDSLAAVYEPPEDGTFPASDPELDDFLIYAAKKSPALRAAFYGWQAVLGRSGYVGALPDPKLVYVHFIENVETRVGPQERRLGLRQSFPWFGTLGTKEDIVLEAANAAYQRYQSERLKLFYQVKDAYYEYYFLGQAIAITEGNFQLLEFWESVARAKYRVGLKQHPDVIKAQVELGKLEDQLLTLRDELAPAAARLRAVVNLPDDIELAPPSEIQVEEIEINRDSILVEALEHNPDLKSLEHIIEKEDAGKRLAGKLARPGFFVGLDYIETGEAVIPNQPDGGKDAWTASLGVSLPIWFGANKARKGEAEAQYRRALNDYSDAQNQLTALTERVVFEYEDAMRKTRLYRDGLVPKAEQSLNASYAAYQAGETDFLNLLDAQRQLLDFQLRHERSKSDLAVKRAEIEMIVGQEVVEFIE